MRVALFTSQSVGHDLIEHFARRSGIDLLAVVYERPHDASLGYRSPLEACRARNVAHINAPTVTHAVASEVEAHRPDIIVAAYYAKLLPMPLVESAPLGGINVHPGKLPYYRGRYPTPWYILNGDTTFGIAIHKITDEVDAGDVYVQREYPIRPDITGHELLRETMDKSAETIIETFDDIASGTLTAKSQAPGGSRYDHIDREWEIDWSLSAEMICRHIRVHAKPYTPAYTFLDGEQVFINAATPVAVEGQPGGVFAHEGRTLIGCGEGSIAPIDISRTINGSVPKFQSALSRMER